MMLLVRPHRSAFAAGLKLIILAIALVLGRAVPLLGQNEKLDAYVKAEMARSHAPGMSVAVVQQGRVIFTQGYGMASIELSAPATANTVYETLSITKQFTAAAVMVLVGEGKIDLNQPVSKYLANLPSAWSGITVRHLLTHTSGIADYTGAPGWGQSARMDRPPLELVKTVFQTPLLFLPGAQKKYSNTNYYLLGMMIEKISGMAYGDFLAQRIFGPLGMTSTRLNNYAAIVPARAAGYHRSNNNEIQNADFISSSQKWAAGGVISNVADLAKWLIALETGSLLKHDTLEQMWAPGQLNDGSRTDYGFGNELDSDRGHRVVGHEGSGLGFNASMIYLPDDHLGIVVLGNLTQAATLAMAHHIAAIYLPAISDEANNGITDSEPKLTELLRQTLLDAAQGKADPARLAPDSRPQLLQLLRTNGPRLLGPLGTLESLILLEDSAKNGAHARRYRAVFSKGQRIIWEVQFAADGTIAELAPRPE